MSKGRYDETFAGEDAKHTTSPIGNARENRLKQICYTRSSVNTAANFLLEKWPSKMRKHLTDAKLSKNDVQTEPSLTNNNGEGETAHTENDLSEMD